MAQYTENIGLHQWEPGDNFLRTEFNQDFAKIDAAFGGLGPRFAAVETARGWLEDAAARMGYEALQCRLSADLEGKVCPPGRGLVFDSFRAGDRITLSGGCGIKSGGGVLLDAGTGLVDFTYHFGTDRYVTIKTTSVSSTREANFTAAGNGILNTLRIYLRGRSDGQKAGIRVCQDKRVLWSGETSVGTAVALCSVSPSVRLEKGVVYTIQVVQMGDYDLDLYTGPGAGEVGFQALCTSGAGKQGSITTTAQNMPPFRAVRAWVRHTGGTIGCAISRNNGAFQVMSITGNRVCTDIRRGTCTETEFLLPAAAQPAGGSVRFRIEVQSDTDVSICDFGAALL